MATGDEIEKRGHILGFKEEIAKASKTSEDAFFTWFNESANKDASFIRGQWDFAYHILAPAWKYISSPEEKISLEIGYGGGRLLAAASRFFGSALGVDIHENSEVVRGELLERGIRNIKLFTSDGRLLPLSDQTIDFAYSFIVLQHVEKYDILKSYLRETFRVLKPGGLAVLYVGRKTYFSAQSSSRVHLALDKILETAFISRGYREFPAKVNETNLVVTLQHAKKLTRSFGFELLAETVSRKRVPDGLRLFGGQHGLVLRKK
jgi:ubiquinone/menaquinone biosynthesis C-methylase UbiE